MKTKFFLSKLLLAMTIIVSMGLETLMAQSGIYVGGHFRRERTHTVTDLKASGFTYVILFNVNVEANGDLTTDGEMIVSNGTYVFGNTQPNYISDVNALKTGITSINRVEYCIGGWGNHSYANIKSLVNNQGTGTNSILYKNFKALKNAIPSVDAMNNDDEETYDVNSATSFHVMLADIGFKTTLAPYMNKGYWQSLATNVNNQRGGAVDKVYLQWYDGGAGNNPCDWNINNIEMHTGDLNYADATSMINKMTSAKNNCNSKGGFIWVYNDNGVNLVELATRINNIFGVKAKNTKEAVNIFKHCNYEGFANGLEAGDYNLARLQSLGILDNDVSSITVAEGFEVIAYDGDNFTGTSVSLKGNTACLVNTSGNWNDKITSLKIRSAGTTNLAGTYYLQNRNSGLYMDVSGGTSATNDGDNIHQWTLNNQTNQQWKFEHLGDGTYKVSAVHSGKVIDVSAISKDDGANVQQWTYYGTLNQQMIAYPTGDGYYKLIAKHCGKIVEVAGFSTSTGGNVQQWTNNNQSSGMWKLIPVGNTNQTPTVSITSPANNAIFNAPALITINANASDADGSISKVDFYNGSTLLGSDNSTPYSFTWNNVAAGTYSLTAKATDNAGAVTTSSAVSITVKTVTTNQAPTVSITSPANNASFNAPASITINANASDADGTISKVEFFNGSTSLGSDNSSPYSFAWNNVAAGTYTITAKATDNAGAVTTSSAITVKVNTVVTNSCSGVLQYVENGGYVAGSIVQNAGSKYSCKPYPYTGWCNGAAWAYAPGTGSYWQDAWTLVGPCSSRMAYETSSGISLSPNPTTGILKIELNQKANVSVYNTMGVEVLPASMIDLDGTLDLSNLSSGMYLVKIDTGSEIFTKTILKK